MTRTIYCPYCGGPAHNHNQAAGYAPRKCNNAPPFRWVADEPGGEARIVQSQDEVWPNGPSGPEESYKTPKNPSPGFGDEEAS